MRGFAPIVLALVAAVAVAVAALAFWDIPRILAPRGQGADSTAVAAPATSAVAGFASTAAARADLPETVVLDLGDTATGAGRATFSAVGDNLANQNLLELADAAAGAAGDGRYDFTGFYACVAEHIGSYDIALINQETTLGGTEAFGFNGYPSYNTPDSMADAVAAAGWNVVNTNTNHTYDTWVASIEHAQGVWAAKSDQLITIGSYADADDRARVRMVACNGLRIAFLSYSYGQNGYTQADLPNDCYAAPYDVERMRAEVAAARRVADAVVVYMHWGTEYQNDPDATQLAQAQELADAGVDLVVGSHAHVIQPMRWFDGADGGRTLVVFGLGDFWSGYFDSPDCILSGMFTCTFVRAGEGSAADAGPLSGVVSWWNGLTGWLCGLFGGGAGDRGASPAAGAGAAADTGTDGAAGESGAPAGAAEGSPDGATGSAGDGAAGVSDDASAPSAPAVSVPARRVEIVDIAWHPVIEHWENGTDQVFLLGDYTAEQARANELLADIDDPYAWIQETTRRVIGDEFQIVM